MSDLFPDIPDEDDGSFASFASKHYISMSAADKSVLIAGMQKEDSVLTTSAGSDNHKLWFMMTKVAWMVEIPASDVLAKLPEGVDLKAYRITELGKKSLSLLEQIERPELSSRGTQSPNYGA